MQHTTSSTLLATTLSIKWSHINSIIIIITWVYCDPLQRALAATSLQSQHGHLDQSLISPVGTTWNKLTHQSNIILTMLQATGRLMEADMCNRMSCEPVCNIMKHLWCENNRHHFKVSLVRSEVLRMTCMKMATF